MGPMQMARALDAFWEAHGCTVEPPLDLEVGAGTFHPETFFGALGTGSKAIAHLQPSRRPDDARPAPSANRLGRFLQYQVFVKPAPADMLAHYADSLAALGVDAASHDIRLIEDDWASPTLGAAGVGWEVRIDGLEVSQITYFQRVAGRECPIVGIEIAYGLERLALALEGAAATTALRWGGEHGERRITWGARFARAERERAEHALSHASVARWEQALTGALEEGRALADAGLATPAYEEVVKASHAFNVLDARGALGAKQRREGMLAVRRLAGRAADAWEAGEAEEAPARAPTRAHCAPGRAGPRERAPLTVEIGCEPLPARSLEALAGAVSDALASALAERGLAPGGARSTYATPQRIAVTFAEIEGAQAPERETVRGPKVALARDETGAWLAPALGFAAKHATTPEALGREGEGANERLVYTREREGRALGAVLPQAIETALAQAAAALGARTMRWAQGIPAWVRPVRWIVARHGAHALGGRAMGCAIGTRAHITGQGESASVEIADAADYERAMARGGISAALERRAQAIGRDARARTSDGCTPQASPERLALAAAGTEHPGCVRVGFQIPPELSEPMVRAMVEDEQAMIAVRDARGALAGEAIMVIDAPGADPAMGGDSEALVRNARHAIQTRLDDLAACLRHDQAAGTGAGPHGGDAGGARAARVRARARATAQGLGGDASRTERAARRTEETRRTLSARRYPTLAGAIAAARARHEGEDARVCAVLAEHDAEPTSPEGRAIALAEQAESVCESAQADTLPKGDADPTGVRRAASEIAQILIDDAGASSVAALVHIEGDAQASQRAWTFVRARTEHLVRERFGEAATDAALALDADRPGRAARRARTLAEAARTPEGQALAQAAKRAASIGRDARERAGTQGETSEAGGDESAAQALEEALERAETARARARTDPDAATLAALAREVPDALARFLDEVRVLEGTRAQIARRAALLERTLETLCSAGDLRRAVAQRRGTDAQR